MQRQLVLVIAAVALTVTINPILAQQAINEHASKPISTRRGIGYPSVAAAFEALKKRSDISFSDQGGWMVAADRADGTLWSFTPAGYPAYPAVVKRTIVQRGGALFVDMSVLCQAKKTACDKLLSDFRELNNKMRESIRGNAR